MRARPNGSAWHIQAPAKINLYLDVLGRRADGYHEVETLMSPLTLCDELAWTPGPRTGRDAFELYYHPATPGDYAADAPADDRNLVCRAIRLLASTAGIEPYGRVTLLKRIPTQAGLGGGSSDAAAALVLANAAWGLRFDATRLGNLAAELGSDVPFFLAGQSAVCRGRGELVEPVDDFPRLNVVLVKPPAGIATAGVYSLLAADSAPDMHRGRFAAGVGGLVDLIRQGRLADAGKSLANRLQAPASRLCHWIDRLDAAFQKLGCLGHLMTGSGSAYFGVVHSAAHARCVARVLSGRNLGVVFAAATRR